MPSPAPAPPRGGTVLAGALSPLTADLVRGPRRPLVVLGVHRAGAYLGAHDRVLPVLGREALALPGALLLAGPGPLPDLGVSAGDVVVVGGGAVRFPTVVVRGVRTWRPARVRRGVASAVPPGSAVDDLLHAATPSTPAWLTDAVRAALAGQVDAVARLVGRGPGLTPSGDDALAAALLARRALGMLAPSCAPDAPDPLVTAVRDRLHATTAVSASLLSSAVDGWATPEVVTLVEAAARGDAAAVSAALPPVLAVGHTSGADLVAGLRTALVTLAPSGRTAA
ncbi:DUF2877 domain-containing protein [Phycicoccus avicenniae]|uniref:oxamate carbamoyltransferase subunit AllH family protein n=1 Tax=Phycicoccus avicenniae TaxID=2828860 RepID=UPI003D2DED58